jgi:AcrR family transcriptional regulator
MSTATIKPTRREERRAQTVREIKNLAMEQISTGGPDAVSLSGIVREMSMSPAAVYRYFANRDALLADLVVDAYNELADFLVAVEQGADSADENVSAVLHATRQWALKHPNAYRLIFQTTIGSGQEFAAERTVPAASRSMAVIIDALAAATMHNPPGLALGSLAMSAELAVGIRVWSERTGVTRFSTDVLALAFLSWTRLHGIISLELGGHLAATGIGSAALFETEVHAIQRQAAQLPPSVTLGTRS